jgi:hypothetical protein
MFLAGLRKVWKTSIMIVSVPAEIWTAHIQNTNQKHYRWDILLGRLGISGAECSSSATTYSVMHVWRLQVTYRAVQYRQLAGIATGYGLDGGGGLTRPPIQWIPGGAFPGGKVALAWSWPLTSNKCRGQESVELYTSTPPYTFMA